MEQYVIKGGNPLVGEVEISGAKNAALAILAAAIMTDETVLIDNLPDVNDINVMLEAISGIGATVQRLDRHRVKINGGTITDFNIEYDYIKKIRASYYLLGALLGKYSKAEVALPGGCNIGSRPIDQHLNGFRALGADVDIEHGKIVAESEHMRGTHLYFDVVSVGATINVMMAATLAQLNELMQPAMEPVALGRGRALILDAGHGGEDGGAVSITGVPESQINLAIVLKLRDVLGLYGVDPILLRETDVSLHDSGAGTLREKKRSDLKNRVAAVEAVEGGTLLSIHQNTYPGSRYHGAHVFYAPTEGSQELAEHFQNSIKAALQPENERAVKRIPDTVYIMNHVTCPAILIECGFLTNPEEEAMLRDEDYQRRLSAVIAAAWLTAP